jgi:hypothetical protein
MPATEHDRQMAERLWDRYTGSEWRERMIELMADCIAWGREHASDQDQQDSPTIAD